MEPQSSNPGSLPPVGGLQPGPQLPHPLPSNPTAPMPTAATPAVADDSDLIEKTWIMKVKQLMGGLSSDPYELSRQFTLLKADYMQKRYGRQTKVEE